MDVDRPMTGRFERWRRQQQPVGGHDQCIGASTAQPIDHCVVAQAQRLEDFQPMRAKLGELGRQHANFGVRPEQYDTLTTALLWSIGQALGSGFDVPTREAWRLAINAICGAMKADVS